MIELVLAADEYAELRARLLGGATETCAVGYACETAYRRGIKRLLVRQLEFAEDADYSRRTLLEAELKPDFVARVTKTAKRGNLAIVFFHSHPGDQSPRFSKTDSQGEQHLAEFFSRRYPGVPHLTVVLSEGGLRAREIGTVAELRVISVGADRQVLSHTEDSAAEVAENYDRQVRTFGSAGQRKLETIRATIVGLGGTGSLISQQLVHLGVRDFVLIDPDTVETTNLNRIANAGPDDVGRSKVEVAYEYIRSISPKAVIESVVGDIIEDRIAQRAIDADFIFCCTDSHGSRAIIQQIAYQYMVPCIDLGVTIAVSQGTITNIIGRIQLLAPGFACLICGDLLSSEQIRRDMMTSFERQADQYIIGAHEPAPAVMSLNSTVASLAITMFLSFVTGVPAPARHLIYNALTSTLRAVRCQRQKNCYICSKSGSLGRGDSWPLLARKD
jgi:molybdopterin-synthase adenylyltransferase